jgi:homocitrate synthase NifV
VGLARQIVVGKHSGASGIVERYRSLGIVLSRDDATLLLPVVRHEALRHKRDLKDRELVAIYLNGAELLKAA